MTVELKDICEVVGAIVAVIGLLMRMQHLASAAAVEHARLRDRVDTMWDFTIRRSLLHAVEKGDVKVNSPVVLPEERAAWFAPIAEDLRNHYMQNGGRRMNLRELIISIEKIFGARLVREICEKYKRDQGECLIMAAAVARGDDKIEVVEVLDPMRAAQKNGVKA